HRSGRPPCPGGLRRGSIVGARALTAAFDLAATAFRLDSSLLRRPRRLGGDSRLAHRESAGQTLSQTFERQVTVLRLRAAIRRIHPNRRSESVEDAITLARTERVRREHVEAHLDLG